MYTSRHVECSLLTVFIFDWNYGEGDMTPAVFFLDLIAIQEYWENVSPIVAATHDD